MDTLQSQKKTKAAKDHHCDYCVGRILKGETYLKSTHIFEGRIYDWKSHIKCQYLVDRMNMHEFCDDGVTEEDFEQEITEAHYELLFRTIPESIRLNLEELISQIRKVELRTKIDYLHRHYLKIDLNNDK